jgi:phosphoribosylformylglycinamidine cyclo-ligase
LITYKQSGVDIDKGNRLVDKIKEMTKKLPKDNIISSIGGFSALYSLQNFGSDLILSSATDGVGTKLIVAQMANKHDSVGIDLVAMNVNDIITTGTRPLFFLDYIAYSELEDSVLSDIVSGIVEGLRQSNAALIGGETAQMPDIYNKGEYDLAGFCVGAAKPDEIMKNNIDEGDIVVGISSSGFHSNGYSLLRKLFFDVAEYSLDTLIGKKTLVEVLLEPTNIYVDVFNKMRKHIKAAVHITGGGFYENIPRVLSGKYDVIIEKGSLPDVDIFKLVQDIGKIDDNEMYRTFNMGVGFVVIVDKQAKNDVAECINSAGFESFVLGYVEKGKGSVKIV